MRNGINTGRFQVGFYGRAMPTRKYSLEALVLRLQAFDPRARHGEKGQGMVEYALILMIISVALIIIISTMGKQVNNMFSNVSNGLNQ